MERAQERSANELTLISLSDIVAALRYRWRSVIATTLAISFLATVVLIVWPNQFISEAQVLVRLGRETVGLDPTSTVSPTVSLQETRLSQVNSVREMLLSRTLAERVVDRVGVDRILEPRSILEKTIRSVTSLLPQSAPNVPEGKLTSEEAEALIRKEYAIQEFQKSLTIVLPKNAYTININVKAGTPFLAQDLTRELLEQYQAYHVEVHRSTGSLEFFEQQAESSHRDALTAQEALRDAKNRMAVLEIGTSQ